MNALKAISLKELPIVEVVWEDHSVIDPEDGSWGSLKELIKDTGPVLVHEVGYVVLNTDEKIVLSHAIAEDDDTTKGLSVILPRDIVEWNVLWEPNLE